jgi:uncharacterized membrane protein YebE (DUF533 family)
MDASLLLTGVLNGVMNSRGKRSRRATHYLTGRSGSFLSNPATLMAAAGLAWGVFETLQSGASAPQAGTGGAQPPAGEPPAPPPAVAAVSSPGGRSTGVDSQVLRMIRVAISAAHADGVLNERERAAILQQAAAAGAAALVEPELREPRPVSSLGVGMESPDEAATLYVLAFTILRADEQLTGAERIYLAQLAHQLRLGSETVAQLERDTGERIDALGDQGQPGG